MAVGSMRKSLISLYISIQYYPIIINHLKNARAGDSSDPCERLPLD